MTNQLALYSGGNRVEPFTSPCTARPSEEQRFQKLMQEHQYLGALPKISETLLSCQSRNVFSTCMNPDIPRRLFSLSQVLKAMPESCGNVVRFFPP